MKGRFTNFFSDFIPHEVLCSKSLYVRIYGPFRKIISVTLICVTGVYKSVNKQTRRIWIWNERKNGGNNHLATEKVQENEYPCNWEIYEIRQKQKKICDSGQELINHSYIRLFFVDTKMKEYKFRKLMCRD